MKIAFLHSDKPRERLLADAFLLGAKTHGHETTSIPLGEDPEPGAFDAVCMVGVKSRERFLVHHRASSHIIYFDKGYSRHKSPNPRRGWEYWRIAIDHHHPTYHLARQHSPLDRWNALEMDIQPWREKRREGPIIIAGSSAKYHEFYGLKEPTAWTRELVRQLRAVTDRRLIYRPKPSWREAVEIKGTEFSALPQTLGDLFQEAHALITHGSNSCFEACIAGIPSVVLGDGVAAPISSRAVAKIERPVLAAEELRVQWAANLAYWQWTEAEMASGEAWEFLGGMIHA